MSRTKALRALLPALAALLVLGLAATAQADYEQVGLFAQSGGAAQLHESKGIAVNTTGAGGVEPGSVYVVAPNRVSRYNAKGDLKEVWGLDTIASGPDLPNQVNTLTVNATSGTYELEAQTARGLAEFTKGSKVATNVFTEVGAFHVGDRLEKLQLTGNITAGSSTVTSVSGSGETAVGMELHGPGIPPNTTVTEYVLATQTLVLSQAATETKTGVSLTAESTVTAVGSNTVEALKAATETTRRGIFPTETTAPIPYNATAAEVKEALVALPAFGPGDVSVTETGTGSYEITFEGSYTGSPVRLESVESTLAGGSPSSSATLATKTAAFTPGFQRCRVDNGDICRSPEVVTNPSGEEVGEFNDLQGIAVDQSSGDVYVLNNARSSGTWVREHNLIEVFSADGSGLVTRFGDAGTFSETFEEGPAKLHRYSVPRRIAVDESGKVYLTDEGSYFTEQRVMCFAPESAGDYEHYAYCGRSQDIEVSLGAFGLQELALDDAGRLYVGNQAVLQELSLAEPIAAPLCTYNTNGQAYAMTVNPLTGELFYYNYNNEKIYRLKPCDPAKGVFEAAQAPIKGSPPMLGGVFGVRALAINPTLSWGPNRPPGVLYAADAESFRVETAQYLGLGYILAPAEAFPPAVLAESVSNTRTASTILRAKIDPNGQGTRYVFQYLTQAAYEANEPGERFAGASEAPAGGGEIEGGQIGEPAVSISGLAPDTAYRYRVIATSECNGEGAEPCIAEGEALSFITYPLFPPGLPDHRVYELVSPAQKHGGEVVPADPEVGSCKECKPRAAGGIFPMQSSPDGEALAYEGQPFNLSEGAVRFDSYVARRTASGWQSMALIPALPPNNVSQVAFDSSLEQGLLGVYESALELHSTADPGARTPLLTETNHRSASGPNELRISYAGHSADFSRIFFAANDSLTEETPFAPEPPDPGVSKKDLYEWHEGKLTLLNVMPGNATVATGAKFASLSPDTHAISEDGSKVFFEDEAGNLYVREDGELTRKVNDPGHFLNATPNGNEVLLTDGHLVGLGDEEPVDDLTEGKEGFQGLVGQSKDLSHIYFVDTKALGDGDANEHGEVAEEGKDNLYSWSGGEARFVARLLSQDNGAGEGVQDWVANPSARTAEASPDGRFLAFASKAPLTGYDNAGFAEAFLYDSATGKLLCASCNPTGEAPLGKTTLRRIKNSPVEFPQPRYLTDEGRLYFDTQDSLSARDTNEGVEDVYEFAPKGAGAQGTCEREAGCTRLISAGTESVDSNLIAVDETGKNVFFDTRDKLSLKDKDELLDIYDAREGGGIAAESEISRAECQGENCQAPASPPNDPTPASSSFEGAGNVKEEPVAKKHAKKKHAKKHKKKAKKHAKQARTAKRNHGGAK